MQPGEKIGRYLLEKPLGEGAMSVVFVAKHPQLEPRVALKILRREVSADKQYAARFLEDARVASSLNHPNIVRVTDFDTSDGIPFIVMDLVDGWPLEQWLKEKGKLEIRDAARVARDIALGLGAAHASKIVHRDVKPSNVLIDSRTGAAKLTDFGAAKRDRPEDQALTAHGQTIGTPRYMAPEQVHGEPVDPRTDLWALGATLYEMLAGQPAFSATSLPRLYQAIMADDPPRLNSLRPDVPPEMAALVARLLSKSRVARPDSADEVAEALQAFARPSGTSTVTGTAQQPVPPKPATPATPAPPARSGGLPKPALIGGGVAAVAVLAGLVFWLLPGGEAPPPEPVPVATTEPSTPPAPAPTTTPAEPAPTASAPAEPAPAEATASPPPAEPAPTAEPAPAEPAPPPATTTAEPAPAAPEPAPTVTAALPPEPELPPIDAEAVRAVLATIPCLDASGTVADGGTVRLAGTAADGEIVAQATAAVRGITGVQSVANELSVVAAPACVSAVQLQRTLRNPVAPAPTVTLNRPDGVYRTGDFLVLNVTMPPDFGGYLYVTMLQDNSVFHLLPEPMATNNRVDAGQTIQIGVEEAQRQAGVRDWQVTPPLNPGYLVTWATEKPLFTRDRGIEESRDAYLSALMPMLDDPSTRATAVAMRRLDFVER